MLIKSRLFTPGPTPLLPAAQLAMAAADIHHRTAEFRALYKKVLKDTQAFIGTKNDVIMFASAGTGMMEAWVTNLTSPGDNVLVLPAGKFGERWKAICQAYGCNVELISAPAELSCGEHQHFVARRRQVRDRGLHHSCARR